MCECILRFRYYVLAAVLGIFFVVWSAPHFNPTGQVQINFWTGFTGPDGEIMVDLVREFSHEHPEIRVSLQRIEWTTYYNKLFVAALSGRGPELFVVHSSSFPRFQVAGLTTAITTPGEPSEFDVIAEDLIPALRSQAIQDGALVALPLDVHPLGLYCNTALFREANLVNPDGSIRPPTDRDSFLKAAQAMTKPADASNNQPARWGFGIRMMDLTLLAQTLMKQFGGRVLSADGKSCVLASPSNVEALNFLRSFITQYQISPSPESTDTWIAFRQGHIAMLVTGIWMIGDLQVDRKLSFEVHPIPKLGDDQGVWAGSHFLCLSNTATPAQKAATLELMKFLSERSLKWVQAGQLPARLSLLNSAEFKELRPQSQLAGELNHLVFNPSIPASFEVLTIINECLERIIRGSTSAEDDLAGAQKEIETVLQRASGKARATEP